jgi:hypothetical protein
MRPSQSDKEQKGGYKEENTATKDYLPGDQHPEQEEYHLIPQRQRGSADRAIYRGSAYQDAKHFGYEPPVPGNARPVAKKLFLGAFDIVHDIFSVNKSADAPWEQSLTMRTYVFASIRWIISVCSLTMAASCPKLCGAG